MTREEAINILIRLPLLRMCTRDTIDKVSDALNMAIETLEERPHGEWIIRRDKRGKHIYSVCSRCNVAHLDTDFPNFCPNCGSDNRPRILDEAVDGEGKDGNVKVGESE